jgi:hypothetical protein
MATAVGEPVEGGPKSSPAEHVLVDDQMLGRVRLGHKAVSSWYSSGRSELFEPPSLRRPSLSGIDGLSVG